MFILIADGASRMRMCQEQQQYHSCNRRKNLNYMFHLFAVTFFPLTVCFRAKRVAKIHLVLFLCLLTEEEPFFRVQINVLKVLSYIFLVNGDSWIPFDQINASWFMSRFSFPNFSFTLRSHYRKCSHGVEIILNLPVQWNFRSFFKLQSVNTKIFLARNGKNDESLLRACTNA